MTIAIFQGRTHYHLEIFVIVPMAPKRTQDVKVFEGLNEPSFHTVSPQVSAFQIRHVLERPWKYELEAVVRTTCTKAKQGVRPW